MRSKDVHQTNPRLKSKERKSKINSGPTGFMEVFAWVYLMISIIAGIILLTSTASDYFFAFGFALIIQGIIFCSVSSVFVRLCDNVANIRKILENTDMKNRQMDTSSQHLM